MGVREIEFRQDHCDAVDVAWLDSLSHRRGVEVEGDREGVWPGVTQVEKEHAVFIVFCILDVLVEGWGKGKVGRWGDDVWALELHAGVDGDGNGDRDLAGEEAVVDFGAAFAEVRVVDLDDGVLEAGTADDFDGEVDVTW